MGASVSLPSPFAQFSRLSLADVDQMIIRHRKECGGQFMVAPEKLQIILGEEFSAEDCETIVGQLEAGEAGKVNALTFLCGAVAMRAAARKP